MCVVIDSPSDATEVGGLADDGSDVGHSACGGKLLKFHSRPLQPCSKLFVPGNESPTATNVVVDLRLGTTVVIRFSMY